MEIAALLAVSRPTASELLRMGKVAFQPFALTVALATTTPGLVTVRLSWYERVPRGEIASGLHDPKLRAGRCCVGWQGDQSSQCDDQRTGSFQKISSRHFVVSISLLRQWTCQLRQDVL